MLNNSFSPSNMKRGFMSGGIYSAIIQPCADSLSLEPQSWDNRMDRVNNSEKHNVELNKCDTFKGMM